jgi:hypothetical protein
LEGPILPHHLWHERVYNALELGLIRRRRHVGSLSGEFPYDVGGGALIKLNLVYLHPKVHKLGYVMSRDALMGVDFGNQKS